MNRFSVRSVLVAAFLVQIVGTVGLVSYLSGRNSEQAVKALAQDLMDSQSDRIVEYLQTYTATPSLVTELNETNIRTGQLDLSNLESWGKYFYQQNQQFKVLAYIHFANPKGEYVDARFAERSLRFGLRSQGDQRIVETYRANAQGEAQQRLREQFFDPRMRPWYQFAKQRGKPGWTPIYKFIIEQPHTLGITFAHPYYDTNQTFQGVLGADFLLTEVNQFLSQLRIGSSGKVFIIERDGNLVASASNQPAFTAKQERIQATELNDSLMQATAKHLKQRFGDQMQVQSHESFDFNWENATQFVHLAPFQDAYGLDWLIVVVAPRSDFTAQIDASTQTTIVLCLGALGGAIASSVLMARWLSHPIRNLSKASQQIARGEFGQPLEPRGGRELSVLATSFNRMSQEIQQAKETLEQKVRDRTAELQQANAEMQALFEAMDQLIFVYDRDGRHLKIPAASERRLMYKREESRIGKKLDEIFPAEIADQFVHYIQQAIDKQKKVIAEYSLNIDDQTIWSESTISPIDDHTVMWVARDITERKLAAQELQAKNETLSRTLEELKTTQSKLIQSEKLAALGQLVAGVAHEMNTPLSAIQSSVANVSEFFEYNLEQLPVFLQLLSPQRQHDFFDLVDRSTESFSILSRMSTREKRSIKRNLRDQLIQHSILDAESVADTLLDIGVYDNLEPFLELLSDPRRDGILRVVYQLTSLQRSVRTMAIATQQASKVVIALKTYAHHDQTSTPVELNVIDGIETAITLHHNQIKRGIEIVRQYESVPAIMGFPDELNQVWSNLIRNAVQAMDHSGRLTIAVAQKKTQVEVNFTDNGPGISAEIQRRIFEPFFTTKTAGEGSGLGLSIVQKIIEKHQGAIALSSVPGQTTFTITLPIS